MHSVWKINFIEKLNKDFKLETLSICKERKEKRQTIQHNLHFKGIQRFQQKQVKTETRISEYLKETIQNLKRKYIVIVF